MKQISKLATMAILMVAGVTGVAAQNPFDVNTEVTNVKTVGQPTGDVGLVFKYGQLHYEILSGNTAKVTGKVRSVCKGRVEIPNIVKHKNKTYTVTAIGTSAFDNQRNLTEIVIPTTVKYIETEAFSCTGLTEVVIPGDNVTLGKNAFFECFNLRVVTLSGRNPSFSDQPFCICDKMQELRVRDSKNSNRRLKNTSAVIKVIR